jgi:hypothetical protein
MEIPMKASAWLMAGAMALAACPALAQNRVQYTAPDGVNGVNVTAATPLPTGKAAIAGASFTTPAGTTAYSSGQLIANSGTAASVTPLQFTVCRDLTGTTGMIRRARIKTADTGLAGATVRLHLYKSNPTPANGDHGAWSTSEADWIGDVDVILDHAFTDPLEKGIGVPAAGSEINYDCNSGVQVVYGLLEARGAITPQGAKTWTVTLEALPN